MKKLLKLVLGFIVPNVLKAEVNHGAGKGADKLKEVLDKVTDAPLELPDGVNISELAENVKDLINAVVDVLNAVGVLDDKPGLDIVNIIPAVMRLVKSARALLDVFDDE